MQFVRSFMRQALLAVCIVHPLPSLADPEAIFDAEAGTVILTGLDAEARALVLSNPNAMRLNVAGLGSRRGMAMTSEELGAQIKITPRFALKAGTSYAVNIHLPNADYRLAIDMLTPDAKVPEVTGFSPSQAVIPANTLRLYLHFSEPMARGQLLDAVSLIASDGTPIPSPFLNLETELWDPSQTRATLLLDPGRIKQGVGPNVQTGAPLQPGESYQVVVSQRLQSAAGVSLGGDVTLNFRVGPSERRTIDPENWQILTPVGNSRAPLTVVFDRIMDSGAVLRMLSLQDGAGRSLRGQITTDGGGWSFAPMQVWQAGDYYLIVDPELEDVSGNTPSSPFDAGVGAVGRTQDPISLAIRIGI